MNEIKCPKCKEVFKVDDAVYTNIVQQVRDQQFQEEINNKPKTIPKGIHDISSKKT